MAQAKKNKKLPPTLAVTDPIKLNRQAFWNFNDGSADRFGIFKKEEQKKLQAQQQQSGQLAYNYERINREIEETDWELFYQQLVDQLFQKFEYILVGEDCRISGVKGDYSRLLGIHPLAYHFAKKAL